MNMIAHEGMTGRADIRVPELIVRPARPDEAGVLGHLHLAHLSCVAMRESGPDEIEAYLRVFPGVDPALVASGRYVVAEAGGQILAGGGWSPAEESLAAALAIAGNGLAEAVLPRDGAILRGVFVCDGTNGAYVTRRLMRHVEADAARAGHPVMVLVATREAVMRQTAPGYRDICSLPLETGGARVLPLLQLSKRIGAALATVA